MTNCSTGHNDTPILWTYEEWHAEGICHNSNTPELWDTDHYPSPRGRPSKDPNSLANQIRQQIRSACSGCPVIQECAASALYFRDTGVVKAGVALFGDTYENFQVKPDTGLSRYDELAMIAGIPPLRQEEHAA